MGNSRGARGQDCGAVRAQLEEVLDATGGPAGGVQLPVHTADPTLPLPPPQEPSSPITMSVPSPSPNHPRIIAALRLLCVVQSEHDFRRGALRNWCWPQPSLAAVSADCRPGQ